MTSPRRLSRDRKAGYRCPEWPSACRSSTAANDSTSARRTLTRDGWTRTTPGAASSAGSSGARRRRRRRPRRPSPKRRASSVGDAPLPPPVSPSSRRLRPSVTSHVNQHTNLNRVRVTAPRPPWESRARNPPPCTPTPRASSPAPTAPSSGSPRAEPPTSQPCSRSPRSTRAPASPRRPTAGTCCPGSSTPRGCSPSRRRRPSLGPCLPSPRRR
mmetsp:Transcript_10954/g.44123  ORF Transcript_10954/g.44123 Transcript_10954/m.44123 type:complete len:214 (+) Transcript_10954:356-997(+)